jgi:hypothetical protein
MLSDPPVARPAQADAQLRVQPARLAVGATPEFVNLGRDAEAVDGGEPCAPASSIAGKHLGAAVLSSRLEVGALLRDRSDAGTLHEPA